MPFTNSLVNRPISPKTHKDTRVKGKTKYHFTKPTIMKVIISAKTFFFSKRAVKNLGILLHKPKLTFVLGSPKAYKDFSKTVKLFSSKVVEGSMIRK